MRRLILVGILLAAGYGCAKLYLHYKVGENVDNALLMLSPMADISYAGVSSTMGGTLSIDDIEINVHGYSGPVEIEKLSLITPGFFHLLSLDELGPGKGGELPESLAVGFTGLQTSVDSDLINMMYKLGQQALGGSGDVGAECTGRNGYSPQILRRLGYSEIIADLELGYRNDNGDIVLESTTVVENMYTTYLEMTVQGAFSPQALVRGQYRPRLVDARLEYIDHSLDERINKLCSDSGLSVEEILNAKLETFNIFGERNGIVFDDQIIEPYVEFLKGKSSFVLTANPIEPVNLSQIDLYKASDVPALLNMTAVAN